MKVFLTITLLCGLACGYDSWPGIGRNNDLAIVELNDQLAEVVRTVQQNLVVSKQDNNDTAKSYFTKLAFGFYHYLDAKNGNFEQDVHEGETYYREAINKTASVVAGPVQAAFSHFVSAVSRRVSAVQEICGDGPVGFSCGEGLAKRDGELIKRCDSYGQNVELHNLALENVKSAHYVVENFLKPGKTGRENDFAPILRHHDGEIVQHFKNVKKVYILLTKYPYACSPEYVTTEGTEEPRFN